jgi:hypothetical protein
MARMIFAMLAFTTVMTIQPAANAAPYWPWCSQYFSRGTSHACAFSSWEQCMDTVRGIGGYCYANPYLAPPAGSARSSHHAARG